MKDLIYYATKTDELIIIRDSILDSNYYVWEKEYSTGYWYKGDLMNDDLILVGDL